VSTELAKSAYVAPVALPDRLALPTSVGRARIAWPYFITVATYHALALLAFLPWFFSWTGAVLAFLGAYVFGTLGMNVGHHRLLTHRSFACPKWLEHSLVILGVCCMQDTPVRWVATHRRHHEHADEQPDPHSPLVNFFWGHMGWIVVDNRDLHLIEVSRYAKDLLRDPFYARLEHYRLAVLVNIAAATMFFAGGFFAELALGGTRAEAVQLGLSLLLWGAIVRTVVVWHITWLVNSVTHLWGYRNYETDESSRNNVLIGLIANGEGWHNNHHADQRSARHGHRWWEFDLTYLTIVLLEKFGLAHRVIRPSPHLKAARARGGRLITREEYAEVASD
jgi:fatty-acid desaturase